MKYIVTLNGKQYEVEVDEIEASVVNVSNAAPAQAPAAPAAPAAPVSAPAQAQGAHVIAPMPGNILAVNVKEGDRVTSGQVMFILEAMKMENEIVSPCDGTVKQVSAQKGSTVDSGAILAVVG
ncbi:MAG: biotin/lipoyl-binding protein [Clostridia bacterium]|jgi:biotin carboxyl carrier protein|nr:biotin/lipoyl-binding protein [Clostridia bacterium]